MTEVQDEPTRGELWQVIEEAHNYLHQWLVDSSSRMHPIYGEIEINMGDWGIRDSATSCSVCLAGLWYLRERGWLLGEAFKINSPDRVLVDIKTDRLVSFLNELRCPLDVIDDDEDLEPVTYSHKIGELLGIEGIPYLEDELMVALGLEEIHWDEYDPEHILAFLQWLLEQRTVGGNSNE